jgi:hypothetical protein
MRWGAANTCVLLYTRLRSRANNTHTNYPKLAQPIHLPRRPRTLRSYLHPTVPIHAHSSLIISYTCHLLAAPNFPRSGPIASLRAESESKPKMAALPLPHTPLYFYFAIRCCHPLPPCEHRQLVSVPRSSLPWMKIVKRHSQSPKLCPHLIEVSAVARLHLRVQLVQHIFKYPYMLESSSQPPHRATDLPAADPGRPLGEQPSNGLFVARVIHFRLAFSLLLSRFHLKTALLFQL